MKKQTYGAAAFALTLVAAGAVLAAAVTTNKYVRTSLSEDIAVSCKDVSIGTNDGVLAAKCNRQRASGRIDVNSTSLDLDTAIYCKCDNEAETSASLAWGTGAGACTGTTFTPSSWSVTTSSTGADYIVAAACRAPGKGSLSSIDAGDTADGLKNSSGSLEKR